MPSLILNWVWKKKKKKKFGECRVGGTDGQNTVSSVRLSAPATLILLPEWTQHARLVQNIKETGYARHASGDTWRCLEKKVPLIVIRRQNSVSKFKLKSKGNFALYFNFYFDLVHPWTTLYSVLPVQQFFFFFLRWLGSFQIQNCRHDLLFNGSSQRTFDISSGTVPVDLWAVPLAKPFCQTLACCTPEIIEFSCLREI